jgi:hypothetical protein
VERGVEGWTLKALLAVPVAGEAARRPVLKERAGRAETGHMTRTKTGKLLAAAALGAASLGAAGLGASSAAAAPAPHTAPAPAAVQAAAPAAVPAGAHVAASGPIVAEAAVPGGGGYWETTSSGYVTASGTATSYGDLRNEQLAQPILGMASTPDGKGYWLVASDGGVFTFGDARFFGSTGAERLNQPVVGMAPTTDGNGYWLVASDGGIFTFGDARFMGSTGNERLNQPVVGMSSTPTGNGYWLVASDGGIFTFGDARFLGSTGNERLVRPVIGMAPTADGNGYWLVASDGGVFTFGDAPFLGSLGASPTGLGTVGILPEGGGYWLLSGAGGATSFGGPPVPVASVPQIPQLPPSTDPSVDTQPSAAFDASCFTVSNVSGCDSTALALINAARSSEGYGPLVLPTNYEALSQTQQLVAVFDAERTSRGLVAVTENGTDDVLAQQGAAASADPTGPAGYSWGSIMSDGYSTPLAADFGWMYDDGPGGTNVDCTVAGQAGCWGHRNNILLPWATQVGVAAAVPAGDLVLTGLFTN